MSDSLPKETRDIWPERLKIRDTRLHDDLGGLGQRIYTTAGQGYEKREYVRGDLYDRLKAALELLAACDLNDANCNSFDVANMRIRNIARTALRDNKS